MPIDLQKILDRQVELEQVISFLEAQIANAPPGHLVISMPKGKGKKERYYCSLRVSGSNGKKEEKRRYIGDAHLEDAKTLAKKGYYESALQYARKERKVIHQFLSAFPQTCYEDVYPKLSSLRQALVEPLYESTEEFVDRWLKEEFPGKGFREGEAFFETARGERVRSKSEWLIADWLFQHGIPYRYECPLKLWDPTRSRELTIYPDFTILDPTSRKEYYLEHFGMMDNEEYYRSAMNRIALYEANGIFEGERLLLSYESSRVPLNIRQLGHKIEHFCGAGSDFFKG